MKFVILSVVCLVGAVVAAPASPKRKRDILPGDPRYGTDYHHQHHQHQESHAANEVQSVYGPPSYAAGQPLHYQETVEQPSNQYVPAPAVNYEIQEHHSTAQNNAYLAPAANAPVAQPANSYLGPVAHAESTHDSYGAPVAHHEAPAPNHEVLVQAPTPVQHFVHHVQVHAAQPAPVHHHVAHTAAPAPQVHQHVQAVHQTPQPAVHHQAVYQAPQQAQTYHVQIVKSEPVHYHSQVQQVRPQVHQAPQTYLAPQHVAQVSTYHESHVTPVQPSYESHESIAVDSSSHESSQLIGNNGGYVY